LKMSFCGGTKKGTRINLSLIPTLWDGWDSGNTYNQYSRQQEVPTQGNGTLRLRKKVSPFQSVIPAEQCPCMLSVDTDCIYTPLHTYSSLCRIMSVRLVSTKENSTITAVSHCSSDKGGRYERTSYNIKLACLRSTSKSRPEGTNVCLVETGAQSIFHN
jgi:hypothetical protein